MYCTKGGYPFHLEQEGLRKPPRREELALFEFAVRPQVDSFLILFFQPKSCKDAWLERTAGIVSVLKNSFLVPTL